MRIGINATILDRGTLSGIGTFAINIANALSCLHEDLAIWTIAQEKRLTIPPDRIIPVLSKTQHLLPNQIYLFRALWDQLYFPQALKKYQVDIAFFPYPEGQLNPRLPQIVTVHDLTPLIFPQYHPKSRIWSFKRRIPIVLDRSAAILAISDATKKDILHYYGEHLEKKIHLCGPAYDAYHYYPRLQDGTLERYGLKGRKYLLSVGNIMRHKNIHASLQAFAELEMADLHLAVVGKTIDGQYAGYLQKEANRLKVAERVHFLDYVPYEDLPVLYSHAKAFLLPSHYEGFGIPVLEAMACGTPVITSNVSSLPEVTGEAAFLVPPKDIGAIKNSIHHILHDYQLRQDMVKKGLQRAKFFSWQKTAQVLLKICQKMGG